MASKGLGKGFAALLADTQEDYNNFTFEKLGEEAEEIKNSVVELEISDIEANPNQPRKLFDEKSLRELADSIAVHGVIMPIVVNRSGSKYMIIAGERRFRASKIAERRTIPAIIKDYDERKIKEISLIENLQREDLNPIEAGEAMKQLMADYDLTQEELSKRIGVGRTNITNTLRILTLCQPVRDYISAGNISLGHAKMIVGLPEDVQLMFAKKMIKEELSVREVESAVREWKKPSEEKKKKNTQASMSVELKDMVSRMQRTFGTKVGAIGNDSKGRIYIDYYTRDDLDRISDLLDIIGRRDV